MDYTVLHFVVERLLKASGPDWILKTKFSWVFLRFGCIFKNTQGSTETYYFQQVTSEGLIDGTGFAFNITMFMAKGQEWIPMIFTLVS